MQATLSSSQPLHSGAVALGGEGLAGGVPGIASSGNLQLGGDLATALQNQLIQQSLQAVLAQALSAVARPRLEELFEIVRDPAAVPAALFGTEMGYAPLGPLSLSYLASGRVHEQRVVEALDTGSPRVLLLGRSGLGRTREAAAYATRLCAEGWTICVARLQNCRKMGAADGVLADRRVLVIVDDLHRHIGASGEMVAPYLDRLHACLAEISRDPGMKVRVLLTLPTGLPPEATDGVIGNHPLLQSFRVLELGEFKLEALEILLAAAADGAGVPLSGDEITAMVEQSDRTPKTYVANVNRAAREGRPLSLKEWQNTAAGTWARAFAEIAATYPQATGVYQLLHVLEVAQLPARVETVRRLGLALVGDDLGGPLSRLVHDGLLRLENNILLPLAADQISGTLQAREAPLPELAAYWEALLAGLQAADLPPDILAQDLLSLSDTLDSSGETAAAGAVLDALLARQPGNEAALIRRGELRLQQEAYEAAVDDLTQAISGKEASSHAYWLRGLAHLKRGDFAAAESDLSVAIAGGEMAAYEARGLARYMQYKMADAEEDLTAAIEQKGDNHYLYRLRGFARYALNQYAAAVADWTRLIEAGEADPSLLFQRGWAHYEAHDLAAAEADLARVLAAGIETPFIFWIVGWLRLSLGQVAAAEADFTQAIARWRDDPYLGGLQTLARLMAEQQADLATVLKQNPALSQEILTAFSSMGPQGAGPQEAGPQEANKEPATEGELEAFAELWAKIIEDRLVAQGIDITAMHQLGALPYQSRAHARLVLRRFVEAEADYQEAQALGGDPASVHYGLGMARACQGELEQAVADLQTAAAQGLTHPGVHFWLGCLYYLLDRPEVAQTALHLALESGYNSIVTRLLLYALEKFSPGSALGAEAAVHLLVGLLGYELQQWAAAEEEFDQLLAQYPEWTPVLVLRGWCRFVQQKLADAERDFDRALVQDAGLGQVYYGRAAARLNQGLFEAAAADYSAALANGFVNANVYVERGAARLELGDLEGAEADLEEETALALDSGQLHHVRGWLRFRQERYDEATSEFAAAIARGFAGPLTWYGVAASRVHLRDFPAAEVAYTQTINMGFALPDVYLERALVRSELGDAAEMEQDLDAVVAAGAGNGLVYEQRSLLRLNRGDYAGTVDDTTMALGLGEQDLVLYLRRGLAEYVLGSYEAAVADLTTVITAVDPDIYPEIAIAFQCRAICHVGLADLEAAQVDCQMAQEVAPDDAATHECWAWLHLAQGDWEAAVTRWQSALQRDGLPNNHFGLGLAYLLSGRLEESVAHYRQGLALVDPAETADPSTIALALRDLEHWSERYGERVESAEAQTTLATIRRSLTEEQEGANDNQ